MNTRKHTFELVLGLTPLVGLLLCLLALPAPPPVQALGSWTIECVDCPKFFNYVSSRSLALDGAGHPHIAYGGDDLYYAYYDGTTWHYETADASPASEPHAALALDGSDYPHISYYDWLNKGLKYAYLDASGWHTETVDAEGDVGQYTSLVLDGNGYPHISYYDAAGDLKYAHKDGRHLRRLLLRRLVHLSRPG